MWLSHVVGLYLCLVIGSEEVKSCVDAGEEGTCGAPRAFTREAWRELYAEEGWRFNNTACAMPGALEGSVPGAILYTWGELLGRLPLQRRSSELRLHLLGASISYEGRANWDLLLRFLPAEVRLHVSLVLGSRANRNEADNVPTQQSADCPQPRADQPRLEIVCKELYYHDVIIETSFEPPDFAVMINPGIGQEDRWTWEASIHWLLQNRVPFALVGSELDRQRSFHAFTAKDVDGLAAPIPVAEETFKGVPPLGLLSDECFIAFLYLSKVGASIRRVGLNPFRFPGKYLPQCPPPEGEAQVLQQAHQASAKQVWKTLTCEKCALSWRSMSPFVWVTSPPKSLDDMCFSWLEVEASIRPVIKSAVIMLIEGFAPGAPPCVDCPLPDDPRLQMLDAVITYPDLDDAEVDMRKLVFQEDEGEHHRLSIPVSKSYVETFLALHNHVLYNLTLPPLKPKCLKRLRALPPEEAARELKQIKNDVSWLIDDIGTRE